MNDLQATEPVDIWHDSNVDNPSEHSEKECLDWYIEASRLVSVYNALKQDMTRVIQKLGSVTGENFVSQQHLSNAKDLLENSLGIINESPAPVKVRNQNNEPKGSRQELVMSIFNELPQTFYARDLDNKLLGRGISERQVKDGGFFKIIRHLVQPGTERMTWTKILTN